jgi:hypothetical protein
MVGFGRFPLLGTNVNDKDAIFITTSQLYIQSFERVSLNKKVAWKTSAPKEQMEDFLVRTIVLILINKTISITSRLVTFVPTVYCIIRKSDLSHRERLKWRLESFHAVL